MDTEEKKDQTMDNVCGCFVILLMIPAGMMTKGYVLMLLWTWFIEPLGAMSIGLVHSIGLCTIMGFIKSGLQTQQQSEDEKEKGIWQVVSWAATHQLFIPIFYLFIGWLVKVLGGM
jgi:hypothetical protein